MAQMIYKENKQKKKNYFPFPLKFPTLDSLQEKKGGELKNKKKKSDKKMKKYRHNKSSTILLLHQAIDH